VSGGDSYVAVLAHLTRAEPRMYHVSELTELRSSIEAEHRDLASREAELTEEILTQLARHFGVGPSSSNRAYARLLEGECSGRSADGSA
jgi:hypothetical protein